ncbi:prephenate dehydrogenase [Chloroflexota bacterium]
MRVAIIGGSGKMGQWFARFLLKDGKKLVLAGRNKKRLADIGEHLGVEVTTSLSSAVDGADMVLISVPIDVFEEVVKKLQPYISKEQIVLDITSTKIMPVDAMHRYLNTQLILGTHPVFGPGAKGIHNQNFVLAPTSKEETRLAQRVQHYLETRGARVTLMTPEEHDRMMAVILGLAHFIAIASADTLLNFNQLKQMAAIGGPTYKVLLTLAESVITEDPELYTSLQMNLPRITEIEGLFLKSSQALADIVRNKNRQEFINKMNTLKAKLERDDPDFGKSYEDMYDLLENP